MRYNNEVGYKALDLYGDPEYVDVAKQLLDKIIFQVNENCTKDGLDEIDVANHVSAALMQLVMDVAEDNQQIHGKFHELVLDIQDLTVEYNINHLV